MAPDPAVFLSTITGTSAGLVAIVGGLLIARFVSLDSEQLGTHKTVTAAAARLAAARARAADVHADRTMWLARPFLRGAVLQKIGQGVTDLAALRQLDDCDLSDSELRPLVDEIAEEFAAAHEWFANRGSQLDDYHYLEDYGGWDLFRKRATDLPAGGWPSVWKQVFKAAVESRADELHQQRERQRVRGPFGLALDLPDFSRTAAFAAADRTDWAAIRARRTDELAAADERAQQHLEDLEAEFVRARESHVEVVRPDARLWWGVGVLVVFAAVGIGLPVWLMSRGPTDLGQVRWVFYPFASALDGLIVYIGVYLAQLTRRKLPLPPAADMGGASGETGQQRGDGQLGAPMPELGDDAA